MLRAVPPRAAGLPLRFCSAALATLIVLAASLTVSWSAGLPSSARVKARFEKPTRDDSTGPLWVWNDLLTEQEIRDSLRSLAAQHVKQVWVHPRPGLMTPYLSPDWFRLWKTALSEAERLDMNVWIYDENSYPSGFAGGLVPEAMPESRGRGLVFRETQTLPPRTEGLLGVYSLRSNALENVTAAVDAGTPLAASRYLVASEVRAGNSPWHGNRCYVNLLSPGVTEKFLELTLEPYRREVGSQFGRRVPGVFTDEPNIRPAGGWPWSEILPQEFKRRWGYDLLAHLPSLARPVGDWQKVRHNYFQVLHEQFIAHWSKPYHDYCAAHRLEWTGHYWDHDWPDCLGVPDNMAMYAWHQRPAIDCLMNQYAEHTHAQFGNVRMVKELSSVANQLGLPRTLCEVYGAGGWDLRFEDMKRIGDWLEVLGVNTLDQHLTYVTIRGARKRDHPQSFSYHEPWWNAYHVSADYFARLSAAMSQGEQRNEILLIEPTTTAWMYQGDEPRLKELGDSFFKAVMDLEAAQVEYDIGCEDLLAQAGRCLVDEGSALRTGTPQTNAAATARLEIGKRAYTTVVLPPGTVNLNRRTVELLGDFAKAGGDILCLGQPPARVDGEVSEQVRVLSQLPAWRKGAPEQIAALVQGPARSKDFTIQRQPGDKGILFHHRRALSDGEMLLLVNTSITSPSAGAFECREHSVEKWGLYTGRVESYPFQPAGSGIRGEFSLPPSGSLLLFLSEKAAAPFAPPASAVVTLDPAGPPQVRRLEPNVLTLDYVDVTAGGEARTNVYFYAGNQFAWKKNGMERDPWDSAVQFKDELITKKFAANSGFEASYRFTIEGEVPAGLAIVIERPDLYAVTCNGQPAKASPGAWWLDKCFGRIPLASAARPGENVVTIKAAPFTMFHELEPAYLLGEFSLRPADHGFVVVAPRPLTVHHDAEPDARGWNVQGCPFYSAGVAYTERFEVTSLKGRYQVALPDWYGSVAEVRVNGKLAGYIDAPPWEHDVTRLLRRGANEVEVTVIGTLKNTLGPHHGKPALGAAWPASFHKAPESGPPPGSEYSTVGYGLFAPFVLKHTPPVPRPAPGAGS